MKKQPGIMSFFLSFCIALFLMAVSVIGTMIYEINVQDRLQLQFLNRMALCDSIFADLYHMEQVFTEFVRTRSEDGIEIYLDSCRVLEEDLAAFQKVCEGESVTMNNIRRLNNFNIYQQEQIKESLDTHSPWYTVYTYVLDGLKMHQQQALEMSQTDMTYARKAYETASKTLSRRVSLVAALFSVAAVAMGVVLVHFSIVTRRILGNMTTYFNQLAHRNWNVPDLEISRYREFTLISQTANHMKQEIREYIRDIKNKARLEKQLNEERLINEKQHAMMIAAQLSALRAQVNPHFLFNSLNLIGVTALIGDSKIVMQMVEATGRILRYSLYHQERMTALDEELEIVEQYLFLQKCRFNDAIEAEIHNDLEGEDIQIPTMSIQPIVENCFKHGFGNRKSLHIHISITWEENKVSICVTDNGVGFEPEKVLKKDWGGIGLSNIQKRLELLYGPENAKMEIASIPGISSSVTLLIPQEVFNENINC